ncbi:MAG: hypothetical protein ACOCRK_10280 [bacterium]
MKLKEFKLTIDKQYKIIFDFDTFINFEEMKDKSIEEITNRIDDILTLMYCAIISNNEFDMEYKEFRKWLNNYPESVGKFTKLFIERNAPVDDDNKKK